MGQPTNSLLAETFLQLNDLKSSVECTKTGYLRPLCDLAADNSVWNEILASVPDSERNWLDAPWVITEFYFYRRIIECFRYFDTKYDPFVKQKVSGLLEALPSIEAVSSKLPDLLDASQTNVNVAVEVALQTSLWGNKMDLSLWPASKGTLASASTSPAKTSEAGKISYGAALDAGRPYILDDMTADTVRHLLANVNGGIPYK